MGPCLIWKSCWLLDVILDVEFSMYVITYQADSKFKVYEFEILLNLFDYLVAEFEI